ncbi:uncharacterized protein LOC134260557 [Saccostrea cucullata]|uniref:uncharacterized protein LOC134260557 n=1 Tax=Saccostrea cuccullata TaxID=36930 RepID=UPI002ED5BC36
MTYMSCKSEPLPTKSNCTSNAGCANTSLHCTVPPQICVPYDSGDITLPSLPLYESYGVSTSPTVQASSKKTLEYATAYLKENKGSAESIVAAYDIIGDNVDLMKSPSNMSSKKQRESLHWFLNVAVQRRVVSSLPNDRPISDIMDVPNHAFIPSSDDCDALEKNMVFHILKVATKYVNCLKPYADCVPKYLDHPHIEETSKKTKYFIADLLDKSENKSEEMISILQHIHENYIAHTEDDPPAVIEKRVFGGDVLTNERAYSAQMAMMNSHSDFFRLAGIIHRPEGLHRLMNFLLFIYQEFYKTSLAPEQGTLFQLRNFIHRVDVSGGDGAVDKFRAHYAFVMDCLDAYILGAVFEVMQLENFDGMPIKWRPPPLLMTAEKSDQYQWLTELAQEILEKHVKLNADKNLTRMSEEAKEMDTQTLTMQGMFDNGLQKFVCTCGKQYKTAGYFKRHLVSTHNWLFREDDDPTPDSSTSESKTDSVANYRASFMKNALLLRDTYDAYSMCDGERVVRNAKFEFLCADVRKHNKYKLWLWRFVAYIIALLSPKQAYEYMWNCAANTTGGVGKNIPNDNLVEFMVQLVKKKIKEQGSNFTYSSAVKAALSSQVQEEIKQNLQQEIQQKTKGKSRTKTNKFSDIEVMVLELRKGNVFSYIPGREFPSFKKFQDASERVNLTKLHTWVSKQKERASFEML